MRVKINLKNIREDKELTQKQLAKKAGVSIFVITRIEQELYKEIYLSSILRLSKALNVSIYDLIEIEE
ncbi:MAG: helix-turn-helix transcriptional regulator [bacterium]|nr:helix-turn-helix transcriptional regulator [bacterium]